MEIYRAISFINYHILFEDGTRVSEREEESKTDEMYVTTGFFDGMYTRNLKEAYTRQGLKSLWHHNLQCIRESRGRYSYQNVFCFSDDDWNCCFDKSFWDDEDCSERYPLTFVMFIQLRGYLEGPAKMREQCTKYARFLSEKLRDCGMAYVYVTVDKNDIVVCIKSRDYKETVRVIKELHHMAEVVYSHSIFCVSRRILEKIQKPQFEYLEKQQMDSICLKGITNSYEPEYHFTLDQKYVEFCEKLVCAIYGADRIEETTQYDYRIYDILGDDDFRLIARAVSLRKLLAQMAPGGLLSFENCGYRFYLFSSSLIMNTDADSTPPVEDIKRWKSYLRMKRELSSPLCDRLEREIPAISEITRRAEYADEKVITYCHAVWQLLQSLKALEAAPAKKYDFYSLYEPFELLVHILEAKVQENRSLIIAEKRAIFDFIHKISMTLHGTQRTDIQFFQIKDFNVIVHYAPAKLRAFYSLLTIKISDFYNDFCTGEKNQYSFIFSPGMFPRISVQELFEKYDEDKRLMLITIPERHLYEPGNLALFLAHEAAHFVGYTLRNRPTRHGRWLKCCVRILCLEIYSYAYRICPEEYKGYLKSWENTGQDFFKEMCERMMDEEAVCRKKNNLYPHEYHSRNSKKLIKEAFRSMEEKEYSADRINVFSGKLIRSIYDAADISKKSRKNSLELTEYVAYSNSISEELKRFYSMFENAALEPLLDLLEYVFTESYADVIAVLTMNIGASKYVESFFNSEMIQKGPREYEETGKCMLPLRWCVVFQVLEEAMQTYKEYFLNCSPDFYNSWETIPVYRLLSRYKEGSVEENYLLQTYGLIEDNKNIEEDISSYSSLYNPSKKDFSNKEYDFFNDKIVIESVKSYLWECIKTYVEALKYNPKLSENKALLGSVYACISDGTALEFVQEIEDFLYAYESSQKN